VPPFCIELRLKNCRDTRRRYSEHGLLMRVFFVLLIAAIVAAFFWQRAKRIDYEPLAEGDVWTMNVQSVSPKGNKTMVIERKVEEPVTQDGRTYLSVRTAADGKQGSIILMRKDDTGLYVIDKREADAKEQLSVMLPIKVGQSWERLASGETVQESVIGTETVTINGKTFENCFHLQSKWPKSGATEDDWEAPNIGTVKSDLKFPNGGTMTFTLTEFKHAQ
jgi:hypothetical protein